MSRGCHCWGDDQPRTVPEAGDWRSIVETWHFRVYEISLSPGKVEGIMAGIETSGDWRVK